MESPILFAMGSLFASSDTEYSFLQTFLVKHSNVVQFCSFVDNVNCVKQEPSKRR